MDFLAPAGTQEKPGFVEDGGMGMGFLALLPGLETTGFLR